MNNSVALKRKNIDLTEDTLRRLSILAAAQGRSLKAYIENLLTAKANSVEITLKENPSPSGDEWFADSNNIKFVEKAISDSKEQLGKTYTLDQINQALGL